MGIRYPSARFPSSSFLLILASAARRHRRLPLHPCTMTTTAINNSSNPSSAWGETAAAQLLQMKHQQPSRTECRATSELLRAILQSTDDSSLWPLTPPRRHSALLHTDDASSQSTKSTMAPFNGVISNISDLPIPIADSSDGQYLSPLQCYVRKHCAEYFAATASNTATKGRQTPVSEGRIGVRCAFCKHLHRDQQAAQASELILIFDVWIFYFCMFMHILCSFFTSFSFRHFFHSSLFSKPDHINLFISRDATVSSFSQLPRDARFGT